MADQRFDRTVQLGLLDRLIDDDPDSRVEAPMSRSESQRRFRLAVKRDLEALFNTTRMPIPVPETFKEVQKSVLFYGLPDVSTVSLTNPSEELQLLQTLEETIEIFEPRLARPHVTNKEGGTGTVQAITFHVEAILMIDPAPERIAFDTVLEIAKGAYSVKDS